MVKRGRQDSLSPKAMKSSKAAHTPEELWAEKRQKRQEELSNKIQNVVRELGSVPIDLLPTGSCEMLQKAAVPCLSKIKASRHAVENEVVGMIESSLDSFEEHLSKDVQEIESIVAAGQQDIAAKEMAVEAASQNTAEKTSIQEECASAVTKANSHVSAAKANLEKQKCVEKKVQAAGEKEKRGAKTESEVHADALLPLVNPNSEAPVSDKEQQKKIALVCVMAKRMGMDPSVIQATPCVLKKDPGERGDFDKIVLKQLVDKFAERKAAATARMQDCDEAEKHEAHTTANLEALLEEAKSAKDHAVLALSDAEKANAASEEAENTAMEEVADGKKKFGKDEKKEKSVKNRYGRFQKVMNTFKGLRDREPIDEVETVEGLGAVVLSLDKRAKRWDRCQKTLQDQLPWLKAERLTSQENVPVSRVCKTWNTKNNALYKDYSVGDDGNALAEEEAAKFSDPGVEQPMSDGERACAYSHIRAWEIAAKQKNPTIIFEDDISLTFTRTARGKMSGDKWKAQMEGALAEAPDDVDVLYLGWSGYRGGNMKHLDEDHTYERNSFVKPAEYVWGSIAYVIWPRGAQKLLAAAKPITQPVDNFMAWEAREGRLKSFVVLDKGDKNDTYAGGIVSRDTFDFNEEGEKEQEDAGAATEPVAQTLGSPKKQSTGPTVASSPKPSAEPVPVAAPAPP